MRTPIVVILSEISPAYSGFNEALGAGIEPRASVVLGEKSVEEGACDEEKEEHEEQPLRESNRIELDELGEGTEDASRLEGEVKAEGEQDGDSDDEEGGEVLGALLHEFPVVPSAVVGEVESGLLLIE